MLADPVAQEPAPRDHPPAPTEEGLAPVGGLPTERQMRSSIEEKVWAGEGSVAEIKMLRAICSHMGDKACRDRASALLGETGF